MSEQTQVVKVDGKEVYVTTIIRIADAPTPAPEPPTPTPTDVIKLAVSKALANRDDGNVAANALTDNADRWSCKGRDCELKLALQFISEVWRVKIRFYKGAQRTAKFDIGISTDGVNFTDVKQDQQGATDIDVQFVPRVNAKVIRLKMKGTDKDEWNSIEYLEVWGVPSTKENECPADKPWNNDTLACGGAVTPTPKPPEPEPPAPQPQPSAGLDEFGVKMLYPSVPNGKYFKNPSYKRSSHNTGTRDTFSMEIGGLLNMETTGFYTIEASKASEECSIKKYGGNHSDSNKKQGRCYGLGVGFSGRPQIYKEYPQHPDGGKHLEKAVYGELGESIGKILGRSFGMKTISYIGKDNFPHFEVHIANKGMVGGKPDNDWKLFYTCVDKGDWDGPPYLENQGIANGGKGLYYVRIDTVTKKTIADFISVREIKHPNAK